MNVRVCATVLVVCSLMPSSAAIGGTAAPVVVSILPGQTTDAVMDVDLGSIPEGAVMGNQGQSPISGRPLLSSCEK